MPCRGWQAYYSPKMKACHVALCVPRKFLRSIKCLIDIAGLLGCTGGRPQTGTQVLICLPARWGTAVFKTAAENAQGQNQQQLTDNGVGSVARSVALLADESPDLAVVVEAWADLPQALRTGIVAMVTSAATN